MNITRKPAIRVQTKLSETRVCPTAAPISSIVGLPATLDGTFAIPPVFAPEGSAARSAHDVASSPKRNRTVTSFLFFIRRPPEWLPLRTGHAAVPGEARVPASDCWEERWPRRDPRPPGSARGTRLLEQER